MAHLRETRARTPRQAFRTAMGRDPGRVHGFREEIPKPLPSLDRAALFHYWHPDRPGVEPCPADFARHLADVVGVDTNGRAKVLIVRPPANAPVRSHCWLVFKRDETITHPLSPGWFLLTAWHDGNEPHPTPLPLDNRVLANLYLQSVKGGRDVMGRDFDTALQYFDHCMSVLDRDKRASEKEQQEYRDDRSADYWNYTKIKNIGHGSKFALHHDGTVAPGRSERNWLAQRPASVPGDVEARDRDETRRAKGATVVQKNDHAAYAFQNSRDLDRLKVAQQIRDFAKLRRRQTVAVSR